MQQQSSSYEEFSKYFSRILYFVFVFSFFAIFTFIFIGTANRDPKIMVVPIFQLMLFLYLLKYKKWRIFLYLWGTAFIGGQIPYIVTLFGFSFLLNGFDSRCWYYRTCYINGIIAVTAYFLLYYYIYKRFYMNYAEKIFNLLDVKEIKISAYLQKVSGILSFSAGALVIVSTAVSLINPDLLPWTKSIEYLTSSAVYRGESSLYGITYKAYVFFFWLICFFGSLMLLYLGILAFRLNPKEYLKIGFKYTVPVLYVFYFHKVNADFFSLGNDGVCFYCMFPGLPTVYIPLPTPLVQAVPGLSAFYFALPLFEGLYLKIVTVPFLLSAIWFTILWILLFISARRGDERG